MSAVEEYPDLEALSLAAAEKIIRAAGDAIAARGRFAISLSGGSTPRETYKLLATPEFRDRIDWSKTHIFWGDERCVPPDDAQSNYRMTREALLDHVPIPAENVHRLRGEEDPPKAAAAYEHELKEFFGHDLNPGGLPPFDLILLGLGDDAHTASLFPGSDAIDEQGAWVVANWAPSQKAWRLTLTAPVLNAGRAVAFLVSGAAKAEPLHSVLHGAFDPHRYPAQLVRPLGGKLTFLVDLPAAKLEKA